MAKFVGANHTEHESWRHLYIYLHSGQQVTPSSNISLCFISFSFLGPVFSLIAYYVSFIIPCTKYKCFLCIQKYTTLLQQTADDPFYVKQQ